jgi:hypothetical protein
MHGRSPSADFIGLYRGLVGSARIIGQAFFMYSSGCMNWHLHANRLSRTYGCQPILSSILESEKVPQKEKNSMYTRSLALSVCAFTVYEGAGALGGYDAEVWNFWSRVLGQETPLAMKGHWVSREEAQKCASEFAEAEVPVKKALFLKWLALGYPDLPEGVGKILWGYYHWTELYQGFEKGFMVPKFDPPVQDHLGAILAGFLRRAAKGYIVAPSMDLHRALASEAGSSDPMPLVQYINLEEEKFVQLLSDKDGLSPFGQWLMRMVDAQSTRMELVEGIVARGEEVQQTKDSSKFKSQGLATKMSQRGRTRFARLRER